jgi:hypothetical protein
MLDTHGVKDADENFESCIWNENGKVYDLTVIK